LEKVPTRPKGPIGKKKGFLGWGLFGGKGSLSFAAGVALA